MKTAALLALLVLTMVEPACYPVKAYHQAAPVMFLLDKPDEPDGPKNPHITLAYIEFDDNGEMYDQHLCAPKDDQCKDHTTLIRPELEKTIAAIKQLESAPEGANGVNYVLFIHGWKNNADNTNNVAGFQTFLRQIYDYYAHAATPGLATAPLMGIYIGWRGASVKVGQDLSYWFRSGATTRVAGPHLEEALYRIMRAVKGSPEDARLGINTQPKSNLIFIGHSFGGRVLERAMTSYFENAMLAFDGAHIQGCEASDGGTPIDAGKLPNLPDLTVLLNEAAPATDAKQFLEFLKCHQIVYKRNYPKAGGDQGQLVDSPLFLSITSEGDAATSIALPIGQAAATWLTLKTRDYGDAADPPEITNQSTYFTHSAANIPALHSHQVRLHGCDESETEIHLAVNNPDPYHFCQVPSDPKFGLPYWNHTPYWIAQIPVAIVPDHSNIFRPQLFNFLQFFLSSESLRAPKTHQSKQSLSIK